MGWDLAPIVMFNARMRKQDSETLSFTFYLPAHHHTRYSVMYYHLTSCIATMIGHRCIGIHVPPCVPFEPQHWLRARKRALLFYLC